MVDRQQFDLALAFDTDDPEFRRGVEVGLVWMALAHHPEVVVMSIHADNAEMVMRMADAAGRPVRSQDVGEDWMSVWFGPPQQSARPE